MRQSIFIIMGGLLLTGCAASGPQAEASLPPAQLPPAQCQVAVATAPMLAFDPHVASPTPMLARDLRDQAAIGGFEDTGVEFYDVQTDDDQQYNTYPSTYERRVLSDRVGVIFH
jgi:hypothetical protein